MDAEGQVNRQEQMGNEQAHDYYMSQIDNGGSLLALPAEIQQRLPQHQQSVQSSQASGMVIPTGMNAEIKRLQQLQQQIGQQGDGAMPYGNGLLPGAQSTNEQALPKNMFNFDSRGQEQQPFLEQQFAVPTFAVPAIHSSQFLPPGVMNADPRFLLSQHNPVGPNSTVQYQMPVQQEKLSSSLPSPHSVFFQNRNRSLRGGVIEPFPEKLHRLLIECEQSGRGDIISFVAEGRAFAIHNPAKFFKDIVPLYFRQSRLSSFKRQLNLYGFELINTGPARGGYFHDNFIRDEPELCRKMRRIAVKDGRKDEGNTGDAGEEEFSKEETSRKNSL